jgi:hypothetical protein
VAWQAYRAVLEGLLAWQAYRAVLEGLLAWVASAAYRGALEVHRRVALGALGALVVVREA